MRRSLVILPFLTIALSLADGTLTLPAQQRSSLLSSYNLSSPQLISQGEGVFAQNCAVGYCHGSAGRAGRGPRLRGRDWDRNYLLKVTQEGIPNSSMPGWKDKLSEQEIASVIAYVLSLSSAAPEGTDSSPVAPPTTPAQAQKSLPSGPGTTAFTVGTDQDLVGDPQRGKLLFFDASNDRNCGSCHRIRGVGNDVGPDLSKQKSRPARDILTDILLPSASRSSIRKPVQVTTLPGETISGVLIEETPSEIKVFDLESVPPVLRTFPRPEVEALIIESRSPMPGNYSETLTIRQLLDLLAFLKDADPQKSPLRLKEIF